MSTSVELTPRLLDLPAAVAARYSTRGTYAHDEMTAEGLWLLYRCTRTFDPGRGASFSTYAYRSIVLGLRRHSGFGGGKRTRDSRRQVVQLDSLDNGAYESLTGGEDRTLKLAEVAEEVRDVLRFLPPVLHAVYVLRYGHGMDLAAIGRRFDLSRQWASLAVKEAESRLEKVIKRRGKSCVV